MSVQVGMVHLVGAGPGDPSLLTLKAVELLQKADAVVYDKLAGWSFLTHIQPQTRLYDVGKQADRHTMVQEEICQLLVDLAREGLQVVRLKGGDPYVFGRGGEEAEVLVAAEIPFQVVPGISSSVAVPGAAGIPVTHRDHCTSFHVITGHERPDREETALDFSAFAKLSGTLVFLMGIRNLSHITQSLLREGKDPLTPVAIVEKGCTPYQRHITGNLTNIVDLVEKHSIQAPAVTVVGTVVDLSSKLYQTPSDQPLRAQRILVGRTRRQASRFSNLLRSQGAIPIEVPLIEVELNADPIAGSAFLEKLSLCQWLVFTSENGVESFVQLLRQQKRDVRTLHSLRIASIGPATTQALLQYGIHADLQPQIYTVEALGQELLKVIQPKQSIALARSDVANPELQRRLQSMNVDLVEWDAYYTRPALRQAELLKSLLFQAEVDWIPFSSSSMVHAFCDAVLDDHISTWNVRFASIGPMTSAAMQSRGLLVSAEAKVQTLDGLIVAIQEAL